MYKIQIHSFQYQQICLSILNKRKPFTIVFFFSKRIQKLQERKTLSFVFLSFCLFVFFSWLQSNVSSLKSHSLCPNFYSDSQWQRQGSKEKSKVPKKIFFEGFPLVFRWCNPTFLDEILSRWRAPNKLSLDSISIDRAIT